MTAEFSSSPLVGRDDATDDAGAAGGVDEVELNMGEIAAS